jgi:hypothetical protein
VFLTSFAFRYFSSVAIKKFNAFARCDICAQFLDRILAASTPEERQQVTEQRAAHRQSITVARVRVMARERISELHPDTSLTIMIDGMDTNKTNVPYEGIQSLHAH